jgi:predicted RNase H-like nuclease (RuvC/YqgF family)
LFVFCFQENVSLIKEINDLRRELKIARTNVHDLEAALGLHRKTNQGHATEALAQITSTNKNAQLERDLQEKLKVIELQQHQLVSLKHELRDIEMTSPNRPSSGTKLAPIMPTVAVGSQ